MKNKNPQEMIKKGEEFAWNLYKKFNKAIDSFLCKFKWFKK